MKMLCLASAALGFTIATAAAAQDAPAPEPGTKKIVIIERVGGHADGSPVQHFRVEGGDDFLANCTGTKDEVDARSPDGRERTRVVLCGNTQISSAERVEKLEHVLSRLESRDDLSADQKAKVTAALREAIEKARGQ